MGGIRRAELSAGVAVLIIRKSDQGTGALTEGIIAEILTNSPTHPHGIKVRLESGEVGRVQALAGVESAESDRRHGSH